MGDFESELKRVREENKITDILSDHGVSVNRHGMAHCPLHSGDNGASFKVYPNNSFYCFGCHKAGDVIDLYSALNNVDFKSAFALLGGRVDKSITEAERAQIRRNRRVNALCRELKAWTKTQRTELELQDSELSREAITLPTRFRTWNPFEERLEQIINERTKIQLQLHNLNDLELRLERKIHETYQ